MVVDAHIDVAVIAAAKAGAFAHHEQCGGLLTAAIAAGCMAGTERGEDARGQIARGAPEPVTHPPDNFRPAENVPRPGEGPAALPPRPPGPGAPVEPARAAR